MKRTVRTLVFYLAVVISIIILNKFDPSGPCTPGSGIIILLFIPLLSFGLFVKATYSIIKKDKTSIIPAIIHGLVFLTFIIFLR